MGSVQAIEPRRLGRYLLEGLLGEGAMGRVYLAFDPKLERHVAIKVMSQEFARVPGAMERFAREAFAMVKLRHPNIVEIFDHAENEQDGMYVVMERLVGIDLLSLVASEGALPEGVAACIVAEVCRALEHAHAWGVIHRDLKPANVIAEWNGRVVLTDFGLVKAFAEKNPFYARPREPTAVMGTPGFMAPEQMLGETMGAETDLFSLGVMYYNLLTGRMPHAATSPFDLARAMQRGEYTDPRTHVREISAASVQLISECLSPRPKDRLPSASELRARLQLVLREGQITDPRDAIARYLRDPLEQSYELRMCQLQHLRERLKLVRIDGDVVSRRELERRIAAIEHRTRFARRRRREWRVERRRDRRAVLAWSLAASATMFAGMGLGFLRDTLGF